MLKVMNFIVDRQREFFEKGVEYLKPLTLREVADAINMHESTVSRVTNEKYVQTPRGLLPLKFFFSSGLSTSTGEDASARSIKAQIEKLVADEDPKNPLTDQQIVEEFAKRGVKIARRTVAKYRDQLNILPARALVAAGFVFEVTRVIAIDEEVEIRHWRVETREGARTFQTRLDDWPRLLPHGGLLVRDVVGDLYHLADPKALDKRSRALLWAFVD